MTRSNAALPPEAYWKTKLPNTPMPYAICKLLNHDRAKHQKGVSVGVGGGGVGVSINPNSNGTTVDINPFSFLPFKYQYRANDDQLQNDLDVALFFLEKDLHSREKMKIYFSETMTDTSFLHRRMASSLPLPSTKLPKILHRFSIQPNSIFAKTMAMTIKECKEPTIKGKTKYCATSLESLVDFVISSFNSNNIVVRSTVVGMDDVMAQHYKILSNMNNLVVGKGSKVVAWHAKPYIYAVFLCHVSMTGKVYVIPMMGENRSKVEAVAICHIDTSRWNPNHLAFKVLKVKRDTVPLYHFLPQDHVVWAIKG